MLVWMDGREEKGTPVGDEAIRARLIQDGSIRTTTSRRGELIRNAYEAYQAVVRVSKKTFDYTIGVRSALERMVRLFEPELVARPEGPGAAIARALGIKTLVNKLSASVSSRVRNALASPSIKSIGFFSSLKLAGHNAP